MEILILGAILFVLFVVWKYWALAIGAGYDPTPASKVYKMLELAGVKNDDVVYDLGSGDGRIVLTAARRFGARAVGIEADPFRFLFSSFLILLSGERAKVRVQWGNFFRKTIYDATVVTVFLYGPTNERLKKKFDAELKPGTRIVSYVWPFENWQCDNALPEDKIYLYIKK